jgi:ribosomal protein S18 acetylase RimI-like enzyme
MKVIPATVGDEYGIAAAHIAAWQAGYRGIVHDAFLDALTVPERARRWKQVLSDPECKLLVAKDAGDVLGFISFGQSRETNAERCVAEIWTLYVAPGSWRQGVGRALMGEALTALSIHGFRAVEVWVLQENISAIGFYTACGFEPHPSSTRLFQLGGQTLAEVLFKRRDAA